MPVSRPRRRRSGAIARNRGTAVAVARPRKKRTNYLYVAASGLIAILVIAGFALGGAGFGHGGGGFGRSGSSEGYVEGIGEQQEFMSSVSHVPESQTVNYNSVPSTSGDHWSQWARYEIRVMTSLAVHLNPNRPQGPCIIARLPQVECVEFGRVRFLP